MLRIEGFFCFCYSEAVYTGAPGWNSMKGRHYDFNASVSGDSVSLLRKTASRDGTLSVACQHCRARYLQHETKKGEIEDMIWEEDETLVFF